MTNGSNNKVDLALNKSLNHNLEYLIKDTRDKIIRKEVELHENALDLISRIIDGDESLGRMSMKTRFDAATKVIDDLMPPKVRDTTMQIGGNVTVVYNELSPSEKIRLIAARLNGVKSNVIDVEAQVIE